MLFSVYIAVSNQERIKKIAGSYELQLDFSTISWHKFKCEKFNFLKKRMCDDVNGCESE